MTSGHALSLAPLLPWPLLGPALALALLAAGYGLTLRARGAGWRLAALLALAAGLLNPSLVSERREPVKDTAVIVLDQSPSQSLGSRASRADQALAGLQQQLAAFPDLELRVVRAGGAEAGETRLFEALERAVADLPRRQRAGVILLTDGQVHDVPVDPAAARAFGPVHTLLTGERDEADRRLEIVRAPSYGLVGKPARLSIRVTDLPQPQSAEALVTLRQDGGPERSLIVPVGREVPLEITPGHGGQTVVELGVAPAARELTLLNNRAGLAINAVRDRLKVLLVSGEPYAGERIWRNVLKSDPAVDLVHFTILRPPDKQDGTPLRELSLIPFPIRELFEVKLPEFDLVIFDRYRQRGVLPLHYLDAIAEYVRKGGALLEVGGAGLGGGLGLRGTPLGTVLPGQPVGRVLEQPFLPTLTDLGRRHPVTAGLAGPGAPGWGRWLRQADLAVNRGTVVMTGAQQRPLLILDRVGEGRVAQLAADQIWLWSRGFEGGGPQAELLRRLAHWLMKEPELEEDELRARVDGRRLIIERRSLRPSARPVILTPPHGEPQTLSLGDENAGVARAEIAAGAPGLYRLSDGDHQAVALVGAGASREFADLRTSPEPLKAVTVATGGAMLWLADGKGRLPEIRRPAPGRASAGPGWLGLTANGASIVTGSRQTPLLPPPLLLVLALGALALAWRREGR
ncbi:MAG: hypothetical protein WCO00_00915 [Rhodospirillaceae bacterium]